MDKGVDMTEWTLRQARSRLGAVADAAAAGNPQRITRRDKSAVVVVDAREYDLLQKLTGKAPVLTFKEMLLAMPQDDGEFEPRSHR